MDYIFNFMGSLYGMAVTMMLIIALATKGLRSNEVAIFSTAIVSVVFIILFGLRTIDTGTDTYAYNMWFESLSGTWSSRDFEPLFTLLGKFVSYFTDNSSIFFSIVTTATIYFLIKAFRINNNLIAVPLSIVMSFSFISGVDLIANGMRSGIALSLATYALIRYINDNKNIYFFIAISIASLLHASCVIFYSALIFIRIIDERFVKIIFYIYIGLFISENLKVFDFIFLKIAGLGIGSHVISRVLAFKYQESDMFSGYAKYYFFAITLIPYLLFKYNYFTNRKIVITHYVMLMPYIMIFSSPSSYRFSYVSYYLMIYILTQSVSYTKSTAKRAIVYLMIFVMIFITYTTKTTLSYNNILFT